MLYDRVGELKVQVTGDELGQAGHRIACRQRLGGVLKYYGRAA